VVAVAVLIDVAAVVIVAVAVVVAVAVAVACCNAKRDIRVKWRARSLAYAKTLLRLQKNLLVRT
jgi:hypothetical protein